jgi:hypothetical protein
MKYYLQTIFYFIPYTKMDKSGQGIMNKNFKNNY